MIRGPCGTERGGATGAGALGRGCGTSRWMSATRAARAGNAAPAANRRATEAAAAIRLVRRARIRSGSCGFVPQLGFELGSERGPLFDPYPLELRL